MKITRLRPTKYGVERFQLDYTDQAGSRKRKTVTGWTEQEAIAHLAQLQKDTHRARAGLPNQLPFDQVAKTFILEKSAAGCRQGYVAELERVVGSFASLIPAGTSPVVHNVQGYLSFRRSEGASPSTIRKERAILSTLFAWACHPSRMYLSVNPVLATERPKVDAKPPRWLMPAEFALMWNRQPDQIVRDIMQLLVCTGLRLGELERLSTQSLRGDMLYCTERKARDWNCLPIGLELRRSVLRLINAGATLNRHKVFASVKETGMAAGLDVTPHVLRHTCASWHVAAGVPIRKVQGILGHSSVTTTERYEHCAQMDWRKEAVHLPPEIRKSFPLLQQYRTEGNDQISTESA